MNFVINKKWAVKYASSWPKFYINKISDLLLSKFLFLLLSLQLSLFLHSTTALQMEMEKKLVAEHLRPVTSWDYLLLVGRYFQCRERHGVLADPGVPSREKTTRGVVWRT